MFEVKGGKGPDFREFFDSVFSLLCKVSFRIVNDADVAEELVQDAFIKLCGKMVSFPTRDEAKYWLIRVVKNASLNWVKRKGRERRAYERVLREPSRPQDTGETSYLKVESTALVREALERLPEPLRVVLVLKEYGELNYKEIGKTLGITEGNVKVRVFRAREKLLELLKEAEPYVP